MKVTYHYYKDALWNYLQKRETGNSYLREGAISAAEDTYYLPMEFTQDYTPAIEKENVFRQLGTVVSMPTGDGQIIAVASDGEAKLTEEHLGQSKRLQCRLRMVAAYGAIHEPENR